MEMERVETGVDVMIKLLEKEGKKALSEVAHKIDVPESTLQLWVDFLVEERVLGIEYKFTKPYVFLNKKAAKKAFVQDLPGIDFFKKSFFDGAKKRKIPDNKIQEMWDIHLGEAIEKQKQFFVREAKKRGLHNAATLFNKYKSNLMSS